MKKGFFNLMLEMYLCLKPLIHHLSHLQQLGTTMVVV